MVWASSAVPETGASVAARNSLREIMLYNFIQGVHVYLVRGIRKIFVCMFPSGMSNNLCLVCIEKIYFYLQIKVALLVMQLCATGERAKYPHTRNKYRLKLPGGGQALLSATEALFFSICD